jgi:hypothetical protein
MQQKLPLKLNVSHAVQTILFPQIKNHALLATIPAFLAILLNVSYIFLAIPFPQIKNHASSFAVPTAFLVIQ